MNTKISMLVNEEKEMYNITFSGTYMKLVVVLLMAIVHILDKFGINKKSDKALVKGFSQSVGDTLYEMILEENEQKLQKDTNC